MIQDTKNYEKVILLSSTLTIGDVLVGITFLNFFAALNVSVAVK